MAEPNDICLKESRFPVLDLSYDPGEESCFPFLNCTEKNDLVGGLKSLMFNESGEAVCMPWNTVDYVLTHKDYYNIVTSQQSLELGIVHTAIAWSLIAICLCVIFVLSILLKRKDDQLKRCDQHSQTSRDETHGGNHNQNQLVLDSSA